ncbi:17310_t:CDS:1 [Acaulospora morrowiae]|uniref:17310_t:CDS:1 n=1 Tax=Acaulospora morrowiae TaxID=94023 RepID=A0A9N9EAM8_9GLOM|nr:17310_t:CDS:1 [Acaulospora morrowiae]
MSPTNEETASGPKLPISKNSRKVFFSFSNGATSFQQGCLGAQQATISGVLNIRYTDEKPIFAKKIEISFVGKEYAFFRGTVLEDKKTNDEEEISDDEISDDEIAENDTFSAHSAKRKIFEASVCIWKSQSKGSYEGVKFLDLPFKFQLPDNLPPSICMDRGWGRIYYMLKAVISRQPINPDSNKRSKMIKMIVPVVRYTVTPSPTPSRWLAKEEGPVVARSVCYDVSLDRETFGPGGTVTVPVKLYFRESQVYLKSIFVGIKEYHELRTNKYETTMKGYIAENTVKADAIPITDGPNNEISMNITFDMPRAKDLVYDVETTYLSVTHKFKAKIKLGGAPDIHLSKVIKVENTMSREEMFTSPLSEVKVLEIVKPHKPIAISQPLDKLAKLDKKSKRMSPFLPFFGKIHVLDPVTQKRISIQLLQIVDSKNPNLVYNSRSLAVPR